MLHDISDVATVLHGNNVTSLWVKWDSSGLALITFICLLCPTSKGKIWYSIRKTVYIFSRTFEVILMQMVHTEYTLTVLKDQLQFKGKNVIPNWNIGYIFSRASEVILMQMVHIEHTLTGLKDQLQL